MFSTLIESKQLVKLRVQSKHSLSIMRIKLNPKQEK